MASIPGSQREAKGFGTARRPCDARSVTAATTETEWIERARAGDRNALDELIALHQSRIYGFGMKMCRDPEDAKDILQETLLAMARGIHDFRGASSLSTWLYTVARSHCIKKRRRGKFEPTRVSSLETEDQEAAAYVRDESDLPDEALASKRLDAAIEDAIAALDPMYREVLVLRDVEGLTAPEVGDILGVSVQAVKSRLHRARLFVRERVAPLFVEPELPAAPGGTCPDVLSLFSAHLEGEISADTCAAMERHLDGCARCRGACDSLKRTLALCRTRENAVVVPPDVQASVRLAVRDFLAEKR